MKASSTDRKTVQLAANGQQPGELIYESLVSLKAEIRLNNADIYKVEPVGIFGSAIAVTKDGTDIANLKMNWRGQIVFDFQDGQEFILKAKGTFYNNYIINNKDEEKLIQYDPEFNWSKFDYNYAISCGEEPQCILLVLLGIYASNYLITVMSGMT